jgi:TRAP-type C4-dicarboxylate transport system permease small subunit
LIFDTGPVAPIQSATERAARLAFAQRTEATWIPAFAGMTSAFYSMRPIVMERVTNALASLRKLEDWLLALLVLFLVGLAGAQIILRVFFATGLSWVDPFARTLVLWTGMLGGLAAVRDEKHIALDLLQRFLSPRAQRSVRILTFGFAALLCAAMAWYSVGLVSIDYAESLQTSGGNTWAAIRGCFAETILPLGFALMAVRFLARAFSPPAHVPILLHHGEPLGNRPAP